MRVRVAEQPVRDNIDQFVKTLKKIEAAAVLPREKIFKAWLNKNTGHLLFDLTSKEDKREWKPVDISYVFDPQEQELFFLVEETNVKPQGFHTQDLTDLSLRILQETFKILNEMTRLLKGPSDLATKMAVISKVLVEPPELHTDRNILIDAWHAADRKRAEELLWRKPEGTYLFRKDPFVAKLEQRLTNELGKKVKCFTATYSCGDHKICDLTLVHSDECWQVYNDDPTLCQACFKDLKDLLSAMRNVLKFPLYH